MAKVYAPPFEYNCDYSGNYKDWEKTENEYVERLRKYCKKNSNSKNPLVGELFRIPMGDGYAQYMVFQTKPLKMIHVPTGDAWDAPDYQTRGVRLQDVKEQVEFNKHIAELQNKA